MGSGSVSHTSYLKYAESKGYEYKDGRIEGHAYTSTRLSQSLNPKRFEIRESRDSEEHPNSFACILGLDVTGSMGSACAETAAALAKITISAQEKFPDIQFCCMGIGDVECDDAPIQMSQFESDIRIAEALDKIYIEHGGGGNRYESYTAAWYMGLNHTVLDCFEKRGHKGIIITMGDEPLNPILRKKHISKFTKDTPQTDIDTRQLYEEASKKFDIYHISISDRSTVYSGISSEVDESFEELLGDNYMVSTVADLSDTINKCINKSLQASKVESAPASDGEGITW